MNISSVSSSSNASYLSVNNTDEITQLQKEKINLQKELQKVNQSKDDAKTKEQKVKELQLEIQQIDAQIQQLKSEKTGQKQNTQQSQMPPSTSNGGKSASSIKGMSDSSQTPDSAKKGLSSSQFDVQV